MNGEVHTANYEGNIEIEVKASERFRIIKVSGMTPGQQVRVSEVPLSPAEESKHAS